MALAMFAALICTALAGPVSVKVKCRAQLVMEDHFPGDVGQVEDRGDYDGPRGGTHYGYVMCSEDEGQVYVLKGETPAKTKFYHGELLELELAPRPVSDDVLTSCDSPSCLADQYEVLSVVAASGEPIKAPLSEAALAASGGEVTMAANGARSVLFVRVEYSDDAVAYCDEACVRDRAFTGQQNMDAMYRESSYGAISFPSSASRIVTVRLAKRASDQSSCPFWNIGLDADAAVRSQHGFEPNNYVHRSYYIPTTIPGCSFGGLAYVGCSSTHCKSWLRTSSGTTLAHEIGHNLGWRHAATDMGDDGAQDSEYGDISGIMGSAWQWRGANAVHRMQSGWIPSSATRTVVAGCGSSQRLELAGLAHTPGVRAGVSIVTMARTGSGGGIYYLSYRPGVGYDATMSSAYRDKVLINYQTGSANAQLVRALDVGDTYDLRAGSQARLTVIGMDEGAATITLNFCGATIGTGSTTAVSTTTNAATTTDGGGDGKGCQYPDDVQSRTNCEYWRDRGYCIVSSIYYRYMRQNCARTCKVGGTDCTSTTVATTTTTSATATTVTTTSTTTTTRRATTTTKRATTTKTTQATTTVEATTTTEEATTTTVGRTTSSSGCLKAGQECAISSSCCDDGLECRSAWVLGATRCLAIPPDHGDCFETGHVCTDQASCCGECSRDLKCVKAAESTSTTTSSATVDCEGEWIRISSDCDRVGHCGAGLTYWRFEVRISAKGSGQTCDHDNGDTRTDRCDSSPCTTTPQTTTSAGCVSWSKKNKPVGSKCKKARDCCSGTCSSKKCADILSDQMADPDPLEPSSGAGSATGVAAGVVAAIAIVAVVIAMVIHRRRHIRDTPQEELGDLPEPTAGGIFVSVRRGNPLYGERGSVRLEGFDAASASGL